MNVLDQPLVEAVAQRLSTAPGLIEKDWHVTRALEVLAVFDFSAALFYPAVFDTGPGLRPHIRIEMSLNASTLPPIARSLGSLVTLAQNKPPEIATFLCVDPVETAADKLSALAWRVLARQRGSENDDPTIVRHVHDLAALEAHVSASGTSGHWSARPWLMIRGGEATASVDPAMLFAGMLDRLATDPLWATEYQDYVDAVSFARPDERLGFDAALAAVRDLIVLVGASA